MTSKNGGSSARRPRADAVRNRDRILAVAKEAFARSGAAASLDDIAKRAGVGPGTLYRHFPTREALLTAVYQAAAERLAASGRTFAQTLPPVEALRAWLMLFVDYVAEKQMIAPAATALLGDPAKAYAATHAPVGEAVGGLVARAVQSGDVRPDLDGVDLIRALAGVATFGTGPDWERSARRLVDILIAGSRPG